MTVAFLGDMPSEFITSLRGTWRCRLLSPSMAHAMLTGSSQEYPYKRLVLGFVAAMTLRDKRSATPAKFFLDSSAGTGSEPGEAGDDGGFSVLEPDHDGRSLNVFKPRQQEPQIVPSCEYVHVHVSTRVYTWPEFKSGKPMPGGDPQIALVGVHQKITVG